MSSYVHVGRHCAWALLTWLSIMMPKPQPSMPAVHAKVMLTEQLAVREEKLLQMCPSGPHVQ